MDKHTLDTSATTFKAFSSSNSHLSVSELQAQWRSICRTRQNALKCQYDTLACSGLVEFKQLGTVAASGKYAGTTRVAAIKRVTATAAQIITALQKAATASAKRDAQLASLLIDAPAAPVSQDEPAATPAATPETVNA